MSSPPEEVGAVFVRPASINVHSDVSTYYRLEYLSIVKKMLFEKGGQALLDRFREGCFGHLLDYQPGSKCGMALHHVVSRQIQSDDNGLWFFINGSRIWFSPKDYALVTGLQFGSSDFDVTGEHDLRQVEVFRKFCAGQQIRVSQLVETFTDFRINDPDGSLNLRVAHVIVLYGMLLGYDKDKFVASWVWALVDDIEAFSRFPWGAYTYQTLSHYTYACHPKKKYHFYGPVWALYVWSIEVIPGLGNTVGRHVDPHAHPRCLRWKFRSRLDVKDLRHLFEEQGTGLEIRPDEFEITTSYWQSVSYPSPIGVHYDRPVNPLREGRQFPPRRVQEIAHPVEQEVLTSRRNRATRMTSHQESEHTTGHEIDSTHRAEGSRRRDRGKRHRPPPNSSSSSSGDHMIRRRDREYLEGLVRKMGEEQDVRMRRQNEDMENRIKRSLKGFFDDLKGFFSCRFADPKGVHSPVPLRTPPPETQDAGDVRDREDVHVAHDDDVPQSEPARHSIHEFGSSSTIPSQQEPSNYNADPLQGYMEIMGQGLQAGNMVEMGQITMRGVHDMLMANFGPVGDIETPAVPRRSQRQRFPSRALESPFVTPGEPHLLKKTVVDRFLSFMNGDVQSVTVVESDCVLPKFIFSDLLSPTASLGIDVIDVFMMSCRAKLMSRDSILPYVSHKNTIITGLEIFKVCETYWRRALFRKRLNWATPGSYDSFADWEVPNSIIELVKGDDGSTTAQSWMGASQIIIPCGPLNGHYVVVRIHLGIWQAELYDPLYYGLDEKNKIERKEQLQPLMSLLPRVLDSAGYWESNELSLAKKTEPLDMVIMGPDEQFTQKDSRSGGPFACMVVERIISGSPSITWGNTRVPEYRKIIGASIFDMCRVDE